MASDSKLAEKKVDPGDVGSIKDVVLALIDTLVNPLLLVSNVPPSEDDQNSVAKQMHAVVLLYNYYHRKHEPKLVFLDFVNFCKLTVLAKPSLVAFLKQNESKGLHTAEDQLSITGKAMKNACNIAASLDTSRDAPNIEGWQISKVAVLLIDSKKENCMLEFGSVTKGVWSPIEKELNESSIKLEISAQQTIGNKRKWNHQNVSMDDTSLLQLAYDAVKDATDYSKSDLEILETHAAYSLTKEKSTTRLYMMQYRGSFSIKKQVPLKFLVESLQGPLAEKLPFGCWRTTEVVNYHHMLPYLKFVVCWLSMNGLHISSLNGFNAQSPITGCKEEITTSENGINKLDRSICSSGMEAACVDNNKKKKVSMLGEDNISQGTGQDGIATDKFDKKTDILDSSKVISGRTSETSANDWRKNYEDPLSGMLGSQSLKMMKHDGSMERTRVVDSASQTGNKINSEVSPHNDDSKEGVEKLNQKLDVLGSVEKEGTRMYDESLGKDNAEFCKKNKVSMRGEARSPVNISQSARQDGIAADRLDKKHDVLDSCKTISGRTAGTSANNSRKSYEGSLSGMLGSQCMKMTKHDGSMERTCVVDSAIQMGNKINSEVSPHNNDSKDGIEKLNQKLDVLGSVEKEGTRMYDESLGKDNAEFCKGSLPNPCRELQTSNVNHIMETGPNSEHTSTEANSKFRVYHHQRRKKNSSAAKNAHDQDNIICLKFDVVDSQKSNQDEHAKEISGDKTDDLVAPNQDVPAASEKELVQFDGDTELVVKREAQQDDENMNVKSILDSEEVQNALALLLRKRQQTHSEMCIMEDTLALWEHNIERIRDGGEAGFAHKCIESILSGNVNQLLPKYGQQNKDNIEDNQTKLSAIYLPGKSPCKDLEYICTVNNWRLPRYQTEPSCGKFLSTVVVKGKDIELCSQGSLESKPSQARDSAASQMIAELQTFHG